MNLPSDFIERTRLLLKNDWDYFLAALEQESPVSIRLNKTKIHKENMLGLLPVPWCEDGYYLEKRPPFTFDPLFHAGCYYVQEASSMFVGAALKQYANEDLKILDLCAAPGGKSTLLANLLSENSLLVSNEVIRSRANILSENITKWGNPNVVVTNNDPERIGKLQNYFDVILVDAPCSGEGMFRKDEKSVDEWSVVNVRLCKERQQRIVADIWAALKPGGLLLYSTCTYNIEENEENILWIRDELDAGVLPVNVGEGWGISPSLTDEIPAYRFFPHKVKGEGFFFALLRKHDTGGNTDRLKAKKDKTHQRKIDLSGDYKAYIKNPDKFTFLENNESWYAIPEVITDHFYLLKSHLNIVSAGVDLGEFKGKDFIPHQSLSMSTHLNQNAFEKYELDWKTAVNYLRKEPLMLPETPKGYILLTYKNIPLGFVKNIGNRANNLYPHEWRIRSANIPAEDVNVL